MQLLSYILVLLLVGGCMFGPDYRRPDVDAPHAFRGPATNAPASLAELPWWEVFHDETLQQLVKTALTNNYDLRMVLARVEQAEAAELQVRAAFFPQIGYEAQATRGRNTLFGNAAPSQASKPAGGYLGTLNAAWELDLFGRLRRLDEAARAEWLATEEAQHGVVLALVGAVAQAYFELLELDRSLAIARQSTDSFGASLKIFNQRLEGGVVSRLDTTRAEAALAVAAATVPDIERQIALKENQLCVLIGCNPDSIPRGHSLLEQILPPEVPAGVPSALLERRPDVRAAEQRLRAANARIGAAIGDALPQFDLTALYGRVSTGLSSILGGGAAAWSLGATVVGPIFQGNRLTGEYRQAMAARDEAMLAYRKTALVAFQEVADALVAHEKLAAVREQQERAVRASREAVKVSLERYQAGRAAYYEVLEAQQQLFPAETALAQTQRDQLLVIVQLYQALGGGWEMDVRSHRHAEAR